MALTAAQIVALRAEFDSDPNQYGYATQIAIGADQTLANMLNHKRDGATPAPAGALGPAITNIKRTDVSPEEVLQAIDVRDFVATPNALACAWFESVTQLPRLRLIDENDANTLVRANINRLVTNDNGTQNRMNALGRRVGSRAEQLFGRDTFITSTEVAAAFGRT